MDEQQRTQQLVSERNGNGRYPQPVFPIYTAPPQENSKTDEWDFRQVFSMLRRRVVVIGAVTIALSATFWVSTLSRQAEYQAKFRLLVEPVTSEGNLAGLTQLPGTNSNQDSLDYDTQIEVLVSPELINPIIKQLSTRYPDISYNSVVRGLTVARSGETKIIEVSYRDSDPQKVQAVLEQLAKGYLKYSLQERQVALSQGIQFVNFQLPQLQGQVNSLQRSLQLFRQRYNFIDPEAKGGQVIQTATGIEQKRLDIQNQLKQARAFYATLKGKSGEQLARSSLSYQPSQGDLSVPVPLAQQPSSTGSDQSTSTEAGSDQQSSTATTSQQSSGTVTLARASGGKEPLVEKESPIYEGLVSQLRALDSQIAALSTRFKENNPTLQSLRKNRQNLLPILHQEGQRMLKNKLVEVANQISLLELQDREIAKAQSALDKQVKQLPVLARQYTDLQRELRIATESLNRFLEKRQSLQIESAQKQLPWQMISGPQLPTAPITGDVKRNLILGAIAGLLAGLGAALLAERLDNLFHTPDSLKETTKLPLLGVIPYHKYLKQLTPAPEVAVETQSNGYKVAAPNVKKIDGYSFFPFLEAFRSLHTNIGFLGSDTPIQSVAISSAVHADGKSTVSLHLAQAAAAMGQRVLLVDADLRRPQVHKLLGLPNEQGLSNAISSNVPVLEVIQQSPSWDNLFVLTSGQIPPDPTKLLSSKKMQNIMEHLRQHFDLVIYDTPPLTGLADSSILAANTAGIILVVRMAKTERSVLLRAIEGLKLSRTTILGTVCNDVKNYNNTTTAYGYYYYYRSRPQQSAEVN